MDVPIWLVDDRWLTWRQSGRRIELSFKRGRMQSGTLVFGYFPPSVVRIKPGGRVRRVVRLTWPVELDDLWNAKTVAAPAPGPYRVAVRIGYGLTPSPEPAGLKEGVEAPVGRWQREAVSPAVPLRVPPYPASPGAAAKTPKARAGR